MIHSISAIVNSKKRPCDDQFVGTMNFSNGSFVHNNNLFNLQTKKNTNGQHRLPLDYITPQIPHNNNNIKMVVILESPHIDEYQANGQHNNTAPAWGRTGYRFNTWFKQALQNNLTNIQTKAGNLLNNNQIFDVYIVNAIQYQCSRGLSLKKYKNKKRRDKSFNYLWTRRGYNVDLCDRLNIIKPEIVINACTINLTRKCVNYNSLRTTLRQNNCVYFEADRHMSCWCNNTIIK